MPIVTDITPQKKRTGYYNIFVDGKFAFGISDLQLSNLGLTIGDQYSASDIERIRTEVVFAKAYTRSLDYISRRRRSEWEMRDYLRRKDYVEAVINQVIERLEKEKYIDDVEFAHAWIADRNLIKPRSRRQLQQELMKKRIAPVVIAEVTGQQGEEQELKNLSAIAQKKLSRYRDKKDLMAYLVNQGFAYADVRRVIDELVAENDKLSGDANQ